MVNLAEKPDDSRVATPSEAHAFARGKVDPREAGRRGGVNSGISRRLRPQRILEEKILASHNGMAILKVLELRRQREAELLAEELRRDKSLVELEQFEIDVREHVEAVVSELEQRRAELASVEAKLEAALTDDDALGNLLRDVGEQRTRAQCVALGWVNE
jgi:hypothetical protein